MANLLPVATQAISLFQTAATVAQVLDNSDSRSNDLALKQLEQQQALQQHQSLQDANLKRQEIVANAEGAEAERRIALKRAVARQRALFGGQGLATNDGSSEAVLLGLFEESDTERQSRERLDKLRTQAIEQDLLQQNRVNTLQRTQTQQRNELSNSASFFDDATTILGAF